MHNNFNTHVFMLWNFSFRIRHAKACQNVVASEESSHKYVHTIKLHPKQHNFMCHFYVIYLHFCVTLCHTMHMMSVGVITHKVISYNLSPSAPIANLHNPLVPGPLSLISSCVVRWPNNPVIQFRSAPHDPSRAASLCSSIFCPSPVSSLP